MLWKDDIWKVNLLECNTGSWCQRIITFAFADLLQFSETFASIAKSCTFSRSVDDMGVNPGIEKRANVGRETGTIFTKVDPPHPS